MDEILFYGTKKNVQYFYLSNFYRKKFVADGITWKTSEHFYQYLKCKFLKDHGGNVSDNIIDSVINASTPSLSKRLAHQAHGDIQQWDNIKDSQMIRVLRCKFQDPILKQKLLDTETAVLKEDCNDWYWGRGLNNTGLNKLGNMLMQVRQELTEQDVQN